MTPRLKQKFDEEILPKLKEQHGISNPMAMPKLDKIILNVGMGNQLDGTKLKPNVREQVISTLTAISGQKPVVLKARKSVANFKLRAGYEVGAMVTVRGERAWELLDRLITLAIPRIKDFRGLPTKSFDGRGNYSFGVQEQGIFPEVNMAEVTYTHGMHVTLVFSNSNDKLTRFVLDELSFPFRKPQEQRQQAA